MNRFQHCLAAAAIISTAAMASASTITLQPNETASKDSFVYAWTGGGPIPNLSGQNFNGGGYEARLGAAYTTGYAGSVSHDAASFIQFDLASLGVSAANVQSATLKLYLIDSAGFGNNPSAGAPVNLVVNAVGASWDENTVTWATRPALYDSADAGSDADIYSTATVSGIGSWVNFDVSTLVQGWLAGDLTNNGFAVLEAAISSGPEAAWFNGAGASDASLRPLLEITTLPEPTSAALLGIAGVLAMRRNRKA